MIFDRIKVKMVVAAEIRKERIPDQKERDQVDEREIENMKNERGAKTEEGIEKRREAVKGKRRESETVMTGIGDEMKENAAGLTGEKRIKGTTGRMTSDTIREKK